MKIQLTQNQLEIADAIFKERWPDIVASSNGRYKSALELARIGAVEDTDQPKIYHVESQSNRLDKNLVNLGDHSCSCRSHMFHPDVICKHRLAVAICLIIQRHFKPLAGSDPAEMTVPKPSDRFHIIVFHIDYYWHKMIQVCRYPKDKNSILYDDHQILHTHNIEKFHLGRFLNWLGDQGFIFSESYNSRGECWTITAIYS